MRKKSEIMDELSVAGNKILILENNEEKEEIDKKKINFKLKNTKSIEQISKIPK